MREDEDRVRRLRAMSDEAFSAYLRRMGRRLRDPFAPRIQNAIKEERARRGFAPGALSSSIATVEIEPAAGTERDKLQRKIADLKIELEAAQLRDGVFA
jgi:hypothetical protein